MSAKGIQVKVKSQPVVVMEAEVARKIRQHSRSSMKAEVCGVLIGTIDQERTVIEACIAGINAAQGGAHVTFTQDTWEHIYKIKDQQFPDDKIVGWYHSHPGFGVFLSEHDLFIQENFFSSPQQVAWVYDPHTDEEGCFGWVGGKTEKLSGVRFGYLKSIEPGEQAASDDWEEGDDEGGLEAQVRVAAPRSEREPAWLIWTGRIMSALTTLFLLMDGVMKLFKPRVVVETTVQLGYPESSIVGIGIVLLVCTACYLVRRTAILGAVLLTGYLGGAVATQVRVGAPVFNIFFPVILGAMLWGGLWLRDRLLQELLPTRK